MYIICQLTQDHWQIDIIFIMQINSEAQRDPSVLKLIWLLQDRSMIQSQVCLTRSPGVLDFPVRAYCKVLCNGLILVMQNM